jgi:hypothetical protein
MTMTILIEYFTTFAQIKTVRAIGNFTSTIKPIPHKTKCQNVDQKFGRLSIEKWSEMFSHHGRKEISFGSVGKKCFVLVASPLKENKHAGGGCGERNRNSAIHHRVKQTNENVLRKKNTKNGRI